MTERRKKTSNVRFNIPLGEWEKIPHLYCHVILAMSYNMIYNSFTPQEEIYEKVQSNAYGT